MPDNPRNLNIIPLTTLNMTPLAAERGGFMLWHLHCNNIDPAASVSVEIHVGDTTTPGLSTLLLTILVPPSGGEGVPLTLSQISFPPGRALSAKASVANKVNVVINTEAR